MSKHLYLVVSATVFTLVCVGHLVRAISAVPVQVGEYELPLYISWIAAVVAGVLAVSAVRLLREAAD